MAGKKRIEKNMSGNINVTLRLPPEIHEQLRRLSGATPGGRISTIVEVAIREYLMRCG